MGKKLFGSACVVTLGLAAIVGSMALAEPAKDEKPAGQPEMKLPPGWTQEDMQACILAATPGKMHEHLAKGAGVWQGKTTMWMAPGTEPMKSECTSKVAMIMDGRYQKMEISGDMPGMGPFNGLGLTGYDNVAKKFMSTWIDNQGTGMMTGTGELSEGGKVLNWKFTYNCPLTKKPVIMREIDTQTGPNSKTLEMFGPDPKSGKEYKMMMIEFTRQKDGARAER